MRRWIKGAAFALGLTIAGAGGVAAECAPYISGGGPEGPAIDGVLVGQEEVTRSLGASLKYRFLTVDGSASTTFSIGHYRINGGEIVMVDCRTYTLIG